MSDEGSDAKQLFAQMAFAGKERGVEAGADRALPADPASEGTKEPPRGCVLRGDRGGQGLGVAAGRQPDQVVEQLTGDALSACRRAGRDLPDEEKDKLFKLFTE